MLFLEEILCKLVAEKLADGAPTRRYMVELRGSTMIGIECDLIERIYDHAISNELLDEIRSTWLLHAREQGIDRVEAEEDFTMTLATFIASLISDRRLLSSEYALSKAVETSGAQS